MEFFTTYDSDDSEFIATFLNVVNHAANQEATNEKHTRSVIMRDRQAAHDRLVVQFANMMRMKPSIMVNISFQGRSYLRRISSLIESLASSALVTKNVLGTTPSSPTTITIDSNNLEGKYGKKLQVY
ncbi:hypothetical protein LXL04_037787 [Taraxacum kok-saghyz]